MQLKTWTMFSWTFNFSDQSHSLITLVFVAIALIWFKSASKHSAPNWHTACEMKWCPHQGKVEGLPPPPSTEMASCTDQYHEFLTQFCYSCLVFSLWPPDHITSSLKFPICICALDFFFHIYRTFYSFVIKMLFSDYISAFSRYLQFLFCTPVCPQAFQLGSTCKSSEYIFSSVTHVL